ncbi:FecCD family ABC transporter permease [Labrys sp. ZIDIC5]|uniref:FecCD family ABC transporter permease n=1 Tax=Labrys sedimenti TaxID=3106036 RepID=UPI002ACAA584|nr:iron chelate uptake ABC transporter family permease subunit [Labrys sp. ZIDIC5]MDZ5451081.1 iron chelate uptake ABC transporter family permease subunit [Labrys sp. ZIDIC5]
MRKIDPAEGDHALPARRGRRDHPGGTADPDHRAQGVCPRGATAFDIAGAYLFDFGLDAQGFAALAGALAGFATSLLVARLAGLSHDPRGLAFILAGALVSMFFIGIANAFLLSDPARRMDFLGWVSGNINHVYADRLLRFWWIGLIELVGLQLLARPLTVIALGDGKATSLGVDVIRVSRLALAAVALAAGSAVAICGPIGFVGLVVPHLVRPFVGGGFKLGLPACAVCGAGLTLLADLAAREAFKPYVLHTGVLMDLMGGVVFAMIVRRYYLGAAARSLS